MAQCNDCKLEWPVLHTHHIIPKSEGGTNVPSNRVRICGGCHDIRHMVDRRERLARRWTPEARAAHSAYMRKWWADHPDSVALRNARISESMRGNTNTKGKTWVVNQSVLGARNRRISESMRGNKNGLGNPGRIRQGWGNGLSACVDCGTSDRPHKSKGLCNVCYLRQYRSQ